MLVVIALLSPLVVRSQTAPAAATTSDNEEVIKLSPFHVTSSADVGYLAQNTLSGSRLNTALADTAAAISVLTPEFLRDIGATSMKDIILFENNAVPDIGDAAGSVNGNPLIGHDEWQLRIRGLPASYARNFFAWENSTDLYNVDRIDQSRGPNSVLFGFGSAGGIVNTSTKQAMLGASKNEITFLVGSWSRYRGTVDVNQVITPGEFAVRLNAVAENGKSSRKFESDKAKRGHLALTYQPTKTSTLRAEGEVGKVNDNVARPWLAIDESSLWRAAGRPTFTGSWPSVGSSAATFWPAHLVVGDDGVVRDWFAHAYGSNANGASAATGWNAPTWSSWPITPAGLAIIPEDSNLAGPDAQRETKYNSESAFYDNQINDRFSIELAFNHQNSDFFGHDADGSRATTYYGSSSEVWGDASADLPSGAVNPNAGRLYLENNWTRRTQNIKSTQIRASAAYQFETGTWGKHRLAAMYERSWRDFSRLEECEVFLSMPNDTTAAEADVNRLYRRHYFQEGNSADIHQGSWRTAVAGTGWVADQQPENTSSTQDTVYAALQSNFLKDSLVTTVGLRADNMDYTFDPGTRDATSKQWRLDPANKRKTSFDPRTLTLGGVYHLTNGVSVFANHSNSRDLPEVRIHLIGSYIPPMPEGEGNDAGLKFDILGGKLYATIGYYTTNLEHSTDWGDIQTSVTDFNTRVLAALAAAGAITTAEQTAHTINANGYMEDRKAKGWELSVIANPTRDWRISANFSINNVVKQNSMAEVKAWADTNSAWWLQKAASYGGSNFPLTPGTSWDFLGANLGWLYQYHINNVVALDGHQARGERKYGANLYTKYSFSEGPLKGFSIGGGGRYQSANVLGLYYNTVVKGRTLWLADALLGYSFKTEFLGNGSWMDLQLNVSNLFDTRKYQIYTMAWWDTTLSTPERIGLQEPRKYTLSASIKF
jgi:outer membrane receptor protein involved in Fe transport